MLTVCSSVLPSTDARCLCLASLALSSHAAAVWPLYGTFEAVLQPAYAAWHSKEPHNGLMSHGAMQVCDHILSSHHPDVVSEQEDDNTPEVPGIWFMPCNMLIV